MSADNGIYILSTPTKSGGREYRVQHLQAVENVEWDEATGFPTTDTKVRIKNAREMWKKAVIFYQESAALQTAAMMLRETMICEYGISYIEIEEIF